MCQDRWSDVDDYFNSRLIHNDPVLEAVLRASEAACLPQIAVAANQGKLLMLLAQSVGARRILEIGTLGGYSTIWLARALPEDGRLISLEVEPKHVEVARANMALAGLSARVEVRLGRGVDGLERLAAEGCAPFDLVFIDADKPSNVEYFKRSLGLARAGALILVDNVVRAGSVLDEDGRDPAVAGVRRLVDLVGGEKRVDATVVQTVGEKGHDGFLVARVR
jgi:predicted O-methyltransferase YrrM